MTFLMIIIINVIIKYNKHELVFLEIYFIYTTLNKVGYLKFVYHLIYFMTTKYNLPAIEAPGLLGIGEGGHMWSPMIKWSNLATRS